MSTQTLLEVECRGVVERVLAVDQESWAAVRTTIASCNQPIYGDTLTAAFTNVAPYVRKGDPMVRDLTPNTPPLLLTGQGGVEPKILREFAAKFHLQLSFLDANFLWGKFVEATQRFQSLCSLLITS